MKKYIDAEKLLAEIERLKEPYRPFLSDFENGCIEGCNNALDDVISLITSDQRDALAGVFPELRENEDERIRKAIFKALSKKDARDVLLAKGVLVSDALAYLEKQKENPESADSIPADCASNAKCEDRSLKHTDSFGTDIRDTPAYWRGWDDAMKQKESKVVEFDHDREQKPAEWDKLQADFRNINQAFEDGKKEVVAHPERYGLCKPAEWSEEQCRSLKKM